MNIKNNYHTRQSIPKGALEKPSKPGRSQKLFTHQQMLPNSTTITLNRGVNQKLVCKTFVLPYILLCVYNWNMIFMIKETAFRPILNAPCYTIYSMLLVKYIRVVQYLDTSMVLSILLLPPAAF